MLIGDNVSGKSSVLLALDLALSGSRHRVESLGMESLISRQALLKFQAGVRRADLLPELIADVFLSDTCNSDLNERLNLLLRDEDGQRMHIAPMLDEYDQDIMHILEWDSTNFPFEYYAVKFVTFSCRPYAGFSRYVHHMMLDSCPNRQQSCRTGVYPHALQRLRSGG